MLHIYYDQVLFLIFQCFVAAFLLLTLFRLRTFFGLSLLLAALGVFQYMQVFLANALYFEIIEGVYVSSGSSVLFTGSLFAILLVYIKEDTQEARRIIYAILSANIVLIILQTTINLGFESKNVLNIYNLPKELFSQNFRISAIGTLLLFLDTFLLIFIFEAVSKFIKPLFFRILIASVFILSIDSIVFAIIGFYGTDQVQRVLISGLISKNIAAIIYAIILTIYIKYNEKQGLPINSQEQNFKDIFHTLTFRQKYEEIYAKSLKQEIALKESERKYKYFVNQTSEGFFKMQAKIPIPTNLSVAKQIELMYQHLFVIECNDNFAKMRGYKSKEEIIGTKLIDLQGGKNKEVNFAALSKFIQSNYITLETKTIGLDKNKNERHFLNNTIGIIENGKLLSFWGTQNEVTEKIKAENALKEANNIINRSSSIAFLWKNDAIWSIEFVSDNILNLCGYSKEEFTTQKIIYLDLIYPDDLEQVKQEVKTASENLAIQNFAHKPYRIITKNNEVKWVQDNTFIRRNKEGIITHYEGVIYDITEKINSEQTLILEKNKAQNYLNVAGVILVNIDPNGIVQMINPKGCEILEYTEEEIIGKNWFENFIPKSDQDKIKKIANLVCSGNIDDVKHFENEILTKTGQKRLIAWTNVLIYDANGNITSSLSSGEDITERKKTERILKINEEKYRTLFEYAPEGILIANSESYYLDANMAMCNMLGLTHKELVGLHATDIVIPTETKNIEPALDIIKSDNTYYKEWQFKRKDGTTFSAEVTVTTMPDGNLLALVKDITERKELETALLNEKSQLKAIIDNIPIMITLYNPNLNMLFLNNTFETKLEVTSKEIIDIDFMKLFYPDEEIRKSAAEFMQKAPKEWKEFPITSKSGNVIISEWTNINLKNGTQIGIGIDITDRKKIQEELQITNKTLRTTLENMTDGFVFLDLDWEYRFLNKKAGELFNRDINSLINKNIWKEFPESINQPFYKNYYKALETQQPLIFEDFYKPWNKWFENRIIPSKDGLAIFFQDITERKNNEKALIEFNNRLKILHDIDLAILSATNIKQIVEDVLVELKKIIPYNHVSVTEYSMDIDSFKFIGVNTEVPNLKIPTNFVPASKFNFLDKEILFKGETQVIEDLSKHTIQSNLIKKTMAFGLNSFIIFPLLSQGTMVGSLAMFSKNMDLFTETNIQIIREIGNQLAVVIQQNILKNEILKYTEDLEEKIAERTEQLEFTNRELRDFAQIVSHDLKAPLRAISQLSFWISEDYKDKIDADGQEQLAMLIGRVKRLDNLIEGILQYSRAGKAREKEVLIDLNVIVKDVVNSLHLPKNVEIKIDNNLPKVLGDPTRFAQVFQNLITNAIKFNDKPKCIINLGNSKIDGFWEFYVSDNGPGIEEKYFDRIFQIFQRLETRDNQEGTGVGLTLVKRIIQIYSGEIWITSKINQGTTFHFTLPIKI
ncbi:PAS domain S-box protein [Lutibacter sp.]|uniref:PAS domain S-box protein n=1 Tax=Lutibacter sp. TaxID=1925666 RepID=UPI0035655798